MRFLEAHSISNARNESADAAAKPTAASSSSAADEPADDDAADAAAAAGVVGGARDDFSASEVRLSRSAHHDETSRIATMAREKQPAV